MDKIYIKNFEIFANHGVFQEEKNLGQKFILDIEASLSLEEAGKTGDLTKSVHYGELALAIEKVFTDNVDINWIALAKSLEEDEAPTRKKSEAEYRKIVSRLLTKDPEFKNILNPTKAVKMATSFVKNEEEKWNSKEYYRFAK